jgi:hypothetical protein
MQQKRNISRRSLDEPAHEVWSHIEGELGPLDKVPAELIRQRLRTELAIAKWRRESAISVPFVVGYLVCEAVLTLCQSTNFHSDASSLDKAKKELKKLAELIKRIKNHPPHRPKDDWFLRQAQNDALRDLDIRRRELRELSGLTSSDATDRAAAEIGPQYHVSASTLISWKKNPRRRKGSQVRK